MFRKRKVKKYFLKHPEKPESLRREVRNISDNMKHIIKDEDIPDFSEFSAYYKDIAPNFDQSNHAGHVKSKQSPKPWYKRLALVVPVSIVLILIMFIAFTPVGHAFADSIYKTIVQWFDNGVDIHHGTSDVTSDIQETVTDSFYTIEDVQSELGISVAYTNQAALNNPIEVEKDDSIIKIQSTYMYDSQQIIVTQTIYANNTEWDSSIQFDDGQPIDETLNNNLRFIGYVQEDTSYAIAYVDNMTIDIYAEKIDYDDFINFIREMVIE